MKHFLIILALVTALVPIGQAQDGKRADELMVKLRQIDLLNQLVPLALNKEQIVKLLPVIEKARTKVKDTQKQELKKLESFEKRVDDTISKSINGGAVPPLAFLKELATATFRMGLVREQVANENQDMVYAVFKSALNVGQLKAAANSLAPQLFDPALDPKKMSDEEKQKFFVKQILLDPLAYDLLLKLAK